MGAWTHIECASLPQWSSVLVLGERCKARLRDSLPNLACPRRGCATWNPHYAAHRSHGGSQGSLPQGNTPVNTQHWIEMQKLYILMIVARADCSYYANSAMHALLSSTDMANALLAHASSQNCSRYVRRTSSQQGELALLQSGLAVRAPLYTALICGCWCGIIPATLPAGGCSRVAARAGYLM